MGCLLAVCVLADHAFCCFQQTDDFLLYFALQFVDLLLEFSDQFKFLHHFDGLCDEFAELFEGSFEQPLNQKTHILDREYFDGVVPVFWLAGLAEDRKGIGTISVHAKKIVSR